MPVKRYQIVVCFSIKFPISIIINYTDCYITVLSPHAVIILAIMILIFSVAMRKLKPL